MIAPTPLRFDLNESALALPRVIREAIVASAGLAHCYPMAQGERTLARVAEHFGVERENVLLTQGIDECIDRLITQFSNMRFVATQPGFNGYWDRIAVMQQPSFALRRRAEDFALVRADVETLGPADFVLLADPDNPTGAVSSPAQLDEIGRRCGKLLVDRTYVGYADEGLAPVEIGPDRLCFHSFSKSFAMAGLRVGALLGPPEIIEALRARQWFCNSSVPSLAAVEAALDHVGLFRARSREVIEQRGQLISQLRALGFAVRATQTNFILVETDPTRLVPYLATHAMVVKDTSSCGLAGHVRISVRTPSDNQTLVRAMRAFCETPHERQLAPT